MTDIAKEPMYDKMLRLGVDMSWYDRLRSANPSKKSAVPTPLNDKICSVLSIYQLQPGGKLFTTTTTGQPYMLARLLSKVNVTKKQYLCAACGVRDTSYAEITKHYLTEENIEKS